MLVVTFPAIGAIGELCNLFHRKPWAKPWHQKHFWYMYISRHRNVLMAMILILFVDVQADVKNFILS